MDPIDLTGRPYGAPTDPLSAEARTAEEIAPSMIRNNYLMREWVADGRADCTAVCTNLGLSLKMILLCDTRVLDARKCLLSAV